MERVVLMPQIKVVSFKQAIQVPCKSKSKLLSPFFPIPPVSVLVAVDRSKLREKLPHLKIEMERQEEHKMVHLMEKSVLELSWKKVKVTQESKAHDCKTEPRIAAAWAPT